jgi:HD superfamily phosphohydrolase
MLYRPTVTVSFASVVMDPVHGAVPLADHEKRLLDHPLMQRLRYIKQNDVTHLVFPGATHTRFGHSVGVMHVASLAFDAVVSSLMSSRKAAEQPSKELTHALKYFRDILRAAGMLHDVGHGPFSHAFETSPAVAALFREASVFENLWNGLDWTKFLVDRRERFDHSAYSIRIAHAILNDLAQRDSDLFGPWGLPFEPSDALCLLEGSSVQPSRTFANHIALVLEELRVPGLTPVKASEALLTVLRSIVFGTINADTMDWVLRDSYFTGSTFGVFNLDYLIASLRLGYSVNAAGISWVGLAVAEKGLGVLEQLAFARLQLYRRVYSHKSVAGFKLLLASALEEILQEPTTRRDVATALSDLSRLPMLHDYTMWARFTDYALSERDSAAHDLISRRKVRFFRQFLDPTAAAVKESKAELRADHPRLRIIHHETRLRADLTGDDADPIRVLIRTDSGQRIKDLQEFGGFEGRRYQLRIVNMFGINAGWARTQPIEPQENGYLICGAGLPCTGKSSVLRHLAGRLGARYFREPEEARWPEAVTRRDEMGFFTALSWFRSVRVQNLINADDARNHNDVAVVDSYYDKMIHCYLGKPAVEWLLPTSDPYFDAFSEVARLDYERLPRADLLVVFRVSEDDWKQFLRIRHRALDQDEQFLQSFESQEYFIGAARQLEKDQGIKVHVFDRRFIDSATPTEDAADQLLKELSSDIPGFPR